MGLLYGRAGRLTAENGGFWAGQCGHCGQTGATIGCCVRGCKANYHFRCAREARGFLLKGTRQAYCARHKRRAACLDEGILPLSLPTLVYIENPY